MSIEIEKCIPLPEGAIRRRFPFKDLEVGDSFFVPDATAKDIGASTSNARKRMPDRMFIARTVQGGVRVWRLS